jgi:hypothetical protein
MRGKILHNLRSTLSAQKYVLHRLLTFSSFEHISQWYMKTKTKYTLLPLPGLERAPFFRRILDPAESWQPHSYPYQILPPLECHITPPFAVINAGLKCAGADLGVIAQACCQTNESQQALKDRLELLCETWNLFEDAKANTKDWEKEKRGKSQRERDDGDIERLSQSSQCTTRSQSRSSRGSAGRKSAPARKVVNTTGDRCGGSRTNIEQTPASGTRKRQWTRSSSGTTLSEYAVSRLGQRQKTSDLNGMVKRWVESACG